MKTVVCLLITVVVGVCLLQGAAARRGRGGHGGRDSNGHHGKHHHKHGGHHLCKKLLGREMRYMSDEEREAEIVSTCLSHEGQVQKDLDLIWDEQSGYEIVFKNWIDNMTLIMEKVFGEDDDDDDSEESSDEDSFEDDDADEVSSEEDISDEDDLSEEDDDEDEKDDITLFCERKKCIHIAVSTKLQTSELPSFCDEIDTTQSAMHKRHHDWKNKKREPMTVDKLAAIFCVKANRAKQGEDDHYGRRRRGGRYHGRAGRYH